MQTGLTAASQGSGTSQQRNKPLPARHIMHISPIRVCLMTNTSGFFGDHCCYCSAHLAKMCIILLHVTKTALLSPDLALVYLEIIMARRSNSDQACPKRATPPTSAVNKERAVRILRCISW